MDWVMEEVLVWDMEEVSGEAEAEVEVLVFTMAEAEAWAAVTVFILSGGVNTEKIEYQKI